MEVAGLTTGAEAVGETTLAVIAVMTAAVGATAAAVIVAAGAIAMTVAAGVMIVADAVIAAAMIVADTTAGMVDEQCEFFWWKTMPICSAF